MTTGYITGGWSYVIAAYCWSGFVLISYTISVLLRLRREEKR